MVFGLWLVAISLCFTRAACAARKGYSYYSWFFAYGIIGLIVILFLPNVNEGGWTPREEDTKIDNGNLIGNILSTIAVVQFIFLIAILASLGDHSHAPRMSGTVINGHPLTQSEWDDCGHDAKVC